MKYCDNCGTQLEDGVCFCPKCGAKIGDMSQGQSAEAGHMGPDLGYHPQNTNGADLGYHPQKQSFIQERMFPVKNLMIISYMFWFLGWGIAFLVNMQKQDLLLKFHINQALWVHILFTIACLLANISTGLSGLVLLVSVILWLCCIGAILIGRDFKIPVLGDIQLIK